jgi:hypothetical protein
VASKKSLMVVSGDRRLNRTFFLGQRLPQRTAQQKHAAYQKSSTRERRADLFVVLAGSLGWEGLMRKTVMKSIFLWATTSGAVLISFPSFPSTPGSVSKPQIVDRALKGDRLTIAPAPAKKSPALVRTGKRVPVGCDRAFSSMSSPQFSSLFGRCMV